MNTAGSHKQARDRTAIRQDRFIVIYNSASSLVTPLAFRSPRTPASRSAQRYSYSRRHQVR